MGSCTGICPILLGFLVLSGIVLGRSAWVSAVPTLRILRDALPATTRGAGAFVRIEGRAEATELLTSPLGGTPCVAWSLEIDRWIHGPRSSRRATILTASRVAPFDVVDAEGRARIDPVRARPWLRDAPSAARKPASFGELPEDVQALLRAEGIDMDEKLRRGNVVVEERTLASGEPCSVFGSCARLVDEGGASYRSTETVGLVSAGERGLLVLRGSATALGRSLRLGIALRALLPLVLFALVASIPLLRGLGR